ncbi:MAG: hypothetical protein KGH62_05335, partial [Candidatus Micrarchaeota archaeon]|nr:hypothetical protein [Candidatus Micrarchaeota archaeon]
MAGYNLKQIWSKYLEKATIISLIAGLTTFFGFSIITVGNAGLTPALPTSLIAQTGIIDVVALFVIAYLLGMVWSKYREEPVTDALLAIFISLGILGFLTVGA